MTFDQWWAGGFGAVYAKDPPPDLDDRRHLARRAWEAAADTAAGIVEGYTEVGPPDVRDEVRAIQSLLAEYIRETCE